MKPMTREEFIAQARAGGFAEAVAIERDASYRLGEHSHPFEAFALITAGEITLQVAGVATRYGVGDTFRLPAGTLHDEWAGAQGVQYLSARKETPQP